MNSEQLPSSKDHEIDLFDLLWIIAQRKWFIASSILICTLGASLYFLLSEKKYIAEAVLKSKYEITENYYPTLKDNLLRTDNIKKFALIKKISENDLALLTIKRDKKDSKKTIVHLVSKDPTTIASLLNEYIQFIGQTTARELCNILDQQIGDRRLFLDNTKKATLNNYRESLEIAKKIKIHPAKDNALLVYEPGAPLYMRGVKALQAEIEVLQQNKNDYSFDEKIRTLQSSKNLLTKYASNPDQLTASFFHSKAKKPLAPAKPKPTIIIFGVMLGLILGLIGSLFHAAAQKKRLQSASC